MHNLSKKPIDIKKQKVLLQSNYLENILEKYCDFKHLSKFESIAIYGNSVIGKCIVNILGEKVKVIVDRDVRLQSSKSLKYCYPAKIEKNDFDVIIIALTNREEVIRNYLINCKNIKDNDIYYINLFDDLGMKCDFFNDFNPDIGYKYLNIGAGIGDEGLHWWTGDMQSGFLIDHKTILPFEDNSIEYVYSSMFFEHIDDKVASNLFKEIYRVLKKNGIFRMVVPNFKLYVNKYKENDFDFFYSPSHDNYETWQRFNVPVDIEHVMVSFISQLSNIEIERVYDKQDENLTSIPPRICFENRLSLYDYYCGPAPELTTKMIKNKANSLKDTEFIDWIFKMTKNSATGKGVFNSWHKNQWDYIKVKLFADKCGFENVSISKFNDTILSLGNIEKASHSKIGLYFNIKK